jgi:hypothetical protein
LRRTGLKRTSRPNTLETVLANTVPDGDCLVWAGYTMPNGYGMASVGGKRGLVHRLVWQLANGPIPEPLTIDHLCRTRACVNVAHMEVVTIQENIRRAGAFVAASAARRSRTHCKNGHEFTPENTRMYRGARSCKQCERTNWRAYAVRRGLRRPAPGRLPSPNGCGTRAAYVRHRAAGEDCAECRAANAAYNLARKRRIGLDPAARALLEARSEGKCEAALFGCAGQATDVHHRITKKAGGRKGDAAARHDRASNTVLVCRPCHTWVTDNPAASYQLGLSLKEHHVTELEPMAYRDECWVLLGDDGSVVGFP